MAPPLHQRASREIYRNLQAIRSFKQAEETLEVLKSAIQADDSYVMPLWSTFFIAYSRPFSGSGALGMIKTSMVPDELRDAHKMVITFRNKVIGHVDPTAVFDSGAKMNRMVVHFRKGELLTHDLEMAPHPREIEKFIRLTRSLIVELSNSVHELLKQLPQFTGLPDGDYILHWEERSGLEIEEYSNEKK